MNIKWREDYEKDIIEFPGLGSPSVYRAIWLPMIGAPGTMFHGISFIRDVGGLNDFAGAGFARLVFERGMLFGDGSKWWGDRGKRTAPHEGLDIRYYRDGAGAVRPLGRALVPAIADGTVIRIIDDLLGRSVFVSHGSPIAGKLLFSIYAHVDPAGAVQPGASVRVGREIAVIAGAHGTGGAAPSHLHLSMALVPESRAEERLDWKSMGPDSDVMLIDPLEHIGTPFEIADGALRVEE